MGMNTVILRSLLAVLIFPMVCFAQSEKLVSVTKTDYLVSVQTTRGTYQFSGYSNKCIETTFIPSNNNANPYPSHTISATPVKGLFSLEENDSQITLSTSAIQLKLTREPFQVSYYYKDKLLLKEDKGFQKTATGQEVRFSISADEALYGGGARALGMNRRGNKLELYNKAHYGYEENSKLMNYCMPIALSSKQYMIHFDNPEIGSLDLDSERKNTITYASIGGRMTYQVIAGENWEELLQEYTAISGRQPLPPRWVFGNFSSRFGYHSEKETRSTVNRFLEDSIPLDAVILDLYWFGKEIQGTLGNLEFYTDSFPTPKQMIADFKAKNINTVLITEPFVLTTSTRWKEAVDADCLAKDSLGKPYTYDFYFGNTGLIDIYSSTGSNWFWKRYKELIDLGVGGFWGDLGEPEVHPEKLLHARGSANQVHNIYGHDWARLLHEKYKIEYPDQRPFILMRSGYSGTQRFGIIPWSGDVNRSWGGLKSQMEIALQMGMQGIAYMHSDLGGFAGDKDDPELYTRWLQYGVFQPVFRPHAQESVPSEPVFKDPVTKARVKKAIELRYALLPYNYTLAHKNTQKGSPLMRPLLFECSADTLAYGLSSSYLWGDAFLVTPVVDSAAKTVTVSFPTASNWYNFYTGKRVQFSETVKNNATQCIAQQQIPVAIDYIPVFVRGGAFVPMIKGISSTSDYKKGKLEIHFYSDDEVMKSTGQLVEDDGLTPGAKTNTMHFEYKRLSKNKVMIEIISESSSHRVGDLVLHHLDSMSVRKVKRNAKNVDFTIEQEPSQFRIKDVPLGSGINQLIFKLK